MKKKYITPEMEIVAKKEYRSPEEIRDLVADGQVAIPANKNHKCIKAKGVGSMLKTKIVIFCLKINIWKKKFIFNHLP